MLKIGLIGGPATGKSSLWRRCCGLPFVAAHIPTTDQMNVGVFACGDVIVHLIDFDGDFVLKALSSHGTSNSRSSSRTGNGNYLRSNIARELSALDAIIYVIDISNRDSFRHLDNWLDLMDRLENCDDESSNNTCKTEKFLIAHKADKLNWAINSSNLSLFCTQIGISDYAVTVGHARLGDISLARAAFDKQSAPEDVLRNVIHKVLMSKGPSKMGDRKKGSSSDSAAVRSTSIAAVGVDSDNDWPSVSAMRGTFPRYRYHIDAEFYQFPVLQALSHYTEEIVFY